jgi:hypothetical protein
MHVQMFFKELSKRAVLTDIYLCVGVVLAQTPSCDGMGPQNNRHVGDGSYCQPEDYLTAAERAATLGI